MLVAVADLEDFLGAVAGASAATKAQQAAQAQEEEDVRYYFT